MSFTEQQEDKNVTFALTPKDYHYELKLAKFLYRIDKIDGPTIEDLAVWCHNFAIGALSRQLGQYYVVMKKKEAEEQKENLLPDFEKVLSNPLISPIPARQPPNYQKTIEPLVEEDDASQLVDNFEKEMKEWMVQE